MIKASNQYANIFLILKEVEDILKLEYMKDIFIIDVFHQCDNVYVIWKWLERFCSSVDLINLRNVFFEQLQAVHNNTDKQKTLVKEGLLIIVLSTVIWGSES